MSWMVLSVFFKMALQLLFLSIMARLLMPQDYGVMASAMIVMSFATLLSDVGVGKAVVQIETLTPKHISSAFSFSVFVGVGASLLVYLLSTYISNFFSMPELDLVLEVLSISFLIRGLSVISEALIVREMHFKSLAIRDVLSYLGGYGVVGCMLAYLNYGVWALVAAHVSTELIRSVWLIIQKPHDKSLRFELVPLKALLVYGGGSSLASFFNTVASKVDQVIIGRYMSSETLGLYNRSAQLMTMPASIFGTVISKVLFPAFSILQADKEKLSAAHFKGVYLTALLVAPASVVLYVFSQELIFILLGHDWEGAVPLFEILAIGIYFRLGYKINGEFARAVGKVYKLSYVQFKFAFFVFCGCFWGKAYGVEGVAYGLLAALILHYIFMTRLGLSVTGLGFGKFLLSHVPGIVISLCVYFSLSLVKLVFSDLNIGEVATFLVGSIVSVIVWFLCVFLLSKNQLGYPIVWFFYLMFKKSKV
ncbi:lipopolysaccharide biosynthesis protein [Aestuariicella sp. G3-2]|uniref:lipopolysaccharide biosynthesis protein n=1 Tax=Pseudomaricurvus albidus TaxID=2842452 RepID=UPI001C0C259B|nr:lipopolysaccharide biosynthesis protein [Aestuariicella albida]MBU3071674.1 lipopolysaccharide biosynthesis protein [Aestuariicella albida]